MKGAWMLVVSLRGAIFGLTYSVLGKTPLSLAVKVSFCFIYAFHVIKVYLRVKKGWATPRLVSFRDLIQKFRPSFPPLSYGSQPLPPTPPLQRWVISRLFGIRDFAYLTVGIRDFRGKRNGDSGWNYESETGIGRRIFGKPVALKNDTSLNLETRSKHLSFRLTISTFSHSVDCNCIQSNKSIYWKACLGLRSE